MKLTTLTLLILLLYPHFVRAQQSVSAPYQLKENEAEVGIAFHYDKGKEAQDSAIAYHVLEPIVLNRLTSSLFYDEQVPPHQQTCWYNVTLPIYTEGVYFSRDIRPGDYRWPNNTNRLLPWRFKQLVDITQADYPGIPSNGTPSTLGDALLLKLADRNYLFAKVVAGTNSISVFRVHPDGSLTLSLSTLGADALPRRAPIVLSGQASTAYEAIQKVYSDLIAKKEVSALKRRADKSYYEAFNYLGWCSWEHHHFDIDEAQLLRDIDQIEASGLPIRYVLIDDGHLTHQGEKLSSFTPDTSRFPSGWSNIIARKQPDKIKWMGLWYALSGYWLGIASQNDFPEAVQKSLFPYRDGLLPGSSDEAIQSFYQHYVRSLKRDGFDFLKVDNQSFTLPLYMGGTQVIRQAKACNLALEEQTHAQQVGLMNCMAQNILNIDHTRYSSVARVSIDYKKYNENMAKSHLFQSYANTLLQGQSVWPDHDMFHSSDSICGGLMARSKALSGGPIYLSDAPEAFAKAHIWPLIDADGKLFRPTAPAIPTPESIIANPLQEGKAYRVFAPTGNEAVSLICYNLNVAPTHHRMTATISKADYLLRETLTEQPAPTTDRLLLFDWKQQTATELTADTAVDLEGFTDRLFHLCPIRNGWAVVGVQEKYLSPATVEVLSSTPEQLELQVHCAGTVRVWVENNARQELRSISVDAPQKVLIHK